MTGGYLPVGYQRAGKSSIVVVAAVALVARLLMLQLLPLLFFICNIRVLSKLLVNRYS